MASLTQPCWPFVQKGQDLVSELELESGPPWSTSVSAVAVVQQGEGELELEGEKGHSLREPGPGPSVHHESEA